MVKVIRANAKINELKALGIISELERWRDRELGTKLTWEKIESFSGYTRQAMSRHPKIRLAYEEAKRALSGPPRPSASRTRDEERKYLDQTIADLRSELQRYRSLEQSWLGRWQRIAFHCAACGLSIEDLDKPLDDIARKDPVNTKRSKDRRMTPASHRHEGTDYDPES